MNLLRCPLCHSPLTENSQGVACTKHHQFDRAREGYLNLLPVQQKNSREPGDARQQLQARQQFLRRGYFDVLLEQLVDLIPSDTASLLDLGSGDGYFSLELQSRLPTTEIIGIDIAKEGARLAAKAARQKHLSTQFCVASNFTLPIMDNSLDVVTRIFAPSKDTELKRVLKAGGHLIIVTPGPGHLLGLRKSLYTEVREHPEPVAPEGFRCLELAQFGDRVGVGSDYQGGGRYQVAGQVAKQDGIGAELKAYPRRVEVGTLEKIYKP